MKLISIARSFGGFILWVVDGKNYTKVEVPKNSDELVRYATVKMSEYKNYSHFVHVMGKFNPYTEFFDKPLNLPKNDVEAIDYIRKNGTKLITEWH